MIPKNITRLEELQELSYYSGTAVVDAEGTAWIIYDGLLYEPGSHMLGTTPQEAWRWGPFKIVWSQEEIEEEEFEE